MREKKKLEQGYDTRKNFKNISLNKLSFSKDEDPDLFEMPSL